MSIAFSTLQIQDVPTRWGSTLSRINRLIECKEAVLGVLSNHTHSLAIPTETEWDKLRVAAQLLTPCEQVTPMLGGEKYAKYSIVLSCVAHFNRSMKVRDEDPAYAVRFKQAFIADINKRYVAEKYLFKSN